MNNADIVWGVSPVPEYRMEFIPPTKKQIRQQKIDDFKQEFKDYLSHFFAWLIVGGILKIFLGV